MLRSALLALMAILSIGATPRTGEPSPYLIDDNTVVMLECGRWQGSGVYVGNGIIATARHVISDGHCTVDGISAKVYDGAKGDFALLRAKIDPDFRALISCDGIKEGHHYLASGYAEGAQRPVLQRLVGSTARSIEKGFAGLVVLRGSVTQGMSGGGVFDEDDGTFVGIINANSSNGVTSVLAYPLSETPLCKKSA